MTTTSNEDMGKPTPPPDYSQEQLKAALASLLDDSKDPDADAAHILGYKDDTHKLSKLQAITATRILDYQSLSDAAPSLSDLEKQAVTFSNQHGPILNLQSVIQGESPRMALAAEFKRASPSKGLMVKDLSVRAGDQAVDYTKAGANIISVLTEAHWFKGSLEDLTSVRLDTSAAAAAAAAAANPAGGKTRPAVLRKDFVVNRYMIAQAAAAGADSILLIVAVLPKYLLQDLIEYARTQFGIEPLVEVHADAELQVALEAGSRVIGVNNRNLHTFQMDLTTSERIAAQLQEQNLAFSHNDANKPPDYTLCALSGMSTALDVDRYRQVGLGMVLIGESLMRAPDPVQAIRQLCLHPDDFAKQQQQSGAGGAYTAGTQLIKVCGVTRAEDALTACRYGANLIGVIFATKSKRKVTAQQATEIVEAVRSFGERPGKAVDWKQAFDQVKSNENPLLSIVQSTSILAQTAARHPLVVGVFQNQDAEFVREMVKTCGLDAVQLHGSEGMAAANRDSLAGVPGIRVMDIMVGRRDGSGGDDDKNVVVSTILESLTCDPAAILLDTSIKGDTSGGGGTGQTFDWSIAQRLQAQGLPVIVAGGLSAESVPDCVSNIQPLGVDVSSGVEQASPGIKDAEKLKAYCQGARQAAQEAKKGF